MQTRRISPCFALLLGLPALAQEATEKLERVTVTARHREEALLDVPASVTVLGAQRIEDFRLRDFSDYARLVPGLSFTYGNGTAPGETGTGMANARTIAIRGIAGAGTTGFYLDDMPLPGAVDPRLLNIARIEVLKGPQGTLYGASSMGGTVRLVSQAPSLSRSSASLGFDLGQTQGSPERDWGFVASTGRVLQADRAALSASVFQESTGGWLQRSYLSDIRDPASPRVQVDNQGAQRLSGAALALRLRLNPEAELTLRLLHQERQDQGPAASYAPLPSFRPVRVIEHLSNVQPEASDRWTLPALSLRWQGQGWRLDSSLGYFERKARDVEDSTEGSAQFIDSYGLGLAPPQAFVWTASRQQRQLIHETRLHLNIQPSWSATLGLHLSRLHTLRHTPTVFGQDVLGLPGRTALWNYDDDNLRHSSALFGELDWALSERWTLTVGDRRFLLRHKDDTRFAGALYGVDFQSSTRNRASGSSPRLALTWRGQDERLVYASATKGFRAGGAQSDLTPILGGCVSPEQARQLAQVQPDSLWSYELGAKYETPSRAFQLNTALYRIDWRNIQQPAFIPACAFYLLGNAGRARMEGLDVEANGRLGRGFEWRAALGLVNARITEQGSSRLQPGTRIRGVPRSNGSLSLLWRGALLEQPGWLLAADLSHVGSAASANSVTDALQSPAYRLLNVRAALKQGAYEWSLALSNVGNVQPNLGDLGYLGYLRFENDGSTPRPMVATLPGRRLTASWRRAF